MDPAAQWPLLGSGESTPLVLHGAALPALSPGQLWAGPRVTPQGREGPVAVRLWQRPQLFVLSHFSALL